MAPEQAAALAEKTATGTRTHDHRITAEEVRVHESLPAAHADPAVGAVRADAIPPWSAGECPLRSYASLAEAVDGLTRRGFSDILRVVDGRLRAVGRGEVLRTEDLTICEFYRFEGISDPDDMEIVYAIASTGGVRGTLADAFGVYSDPATSAALEGVPIREGC